MIDTPNKPEFSNELSEAVAGSLSILMQVLGKSDLALKGGDVGPVHQAMQNAGQVIIGLEKGQLVVDRVSANDQDSVAEVVDLGKVRSKSDDEESTDKEDK